MFRIIVFTISLLSIGIVEAQDTTHYDLQFNISGRRIRGTFQQFVYANKLDFRLENKHWAVHNSTSYRYNETNGQTIENNWYHLTSVSYFIKNKALFPTVFYHFDNNLMFRVNERNLFGGGLSSIKRWAGQYIRLDVGAGYDITNYNGDEFENTTQLGAVRKRRVLILRLLNEHKLFKGKVILSNDFFYRHSLEENTDYYFWIAPKLALRVFKNLSISARYEYRLENVHLSALSNFNTTILYGLNFHLGN